MPHKSLNDGLIPAGVSPDEALKDGGVDTLVALMDSYDTPFYKTIEHTSSIIGSDDVVVIKINNQWNGDTARNRTHTNSDVIKGLM